jgi:hypothetical protein
MTRHSDRQAMRELLRRSDDPQVHERVRAYLDGSITKQQLYRDRSVAPVLSAWYREAIAKARAKGFDPEQVRRQVEQTQQEHEVRLEDMDEALAELRRQVDRLVSGE